MSWRVGHRVAAVVLAGLLVAPAANAQDGAMWRDQYGRSMEFEFLGGGGGRPAAVATSANEMARLFDRICLKSSGALDPVAAAAEAEGFQIKLTGAPVGKNQPESTMLLASKPGAVVSQTTRLLEFGFTQCNLTFYTPLRPTEDEVLAAAIAAIGREPDNAATKIKPNGKPNNRYQPEWRFTDATGKQYVAQFNVMKSNAYMPGDRVLFGLREVLEKKS